MGTTERRILILKALCRRRYDTVDNLATEFGVSRRTILRDTEILSLIEPIYTRAGGHGGGVYVQKNYFYLNLYLSQNELAVLLKILNFSDDIVKMGILESPEIDIISGITSKYSKPSSMEGEKSENRRKAIIY